MRPEPGAGRPSAVGGLLAEYAALFQRERAKTDALAAPSAELERACEIATGA